MENNPYDVLMTLPNSKISPDQIAILTAMLEGIISRPAASASLTPAGKRAAESHDGRGNSSDLLHIGLGGALASGIGSLLMFGLLAAMMALGAGPGETAMPTSAVIMISTPMRSLNSEMTSRAIWPMPRPVGLSVVVCISASCRAGPTRC